MAKRNSDNPGRRCFANKSDEEVSWLISLDKLEPQAFHKTCASFSRIEKKSHYTSFKYGITNDTNCVTIEVLLQSV